MYLRKYKIEMLTVYESFSIATHDKQLNSVSIDIIFASFFRVQKQ